MNEINFTLDQTRFHVNDINLWGSSVSSYTFRTGDYTYVKLTELDYIEFEKQRQIESIKFLSEK